MLPVVFSLGTTELIIVALVGICAIGAPIVVIGLIWFATQKASPLGKANVHLPDDLGMPVQIRALNPADKPNATSATWEGTELVVRSEESSSKSLFDVPLAGLEYCLVTFRFRIKTNQMAGAVYPEMWCRVPEKGQFFSRGIDRKIRGAVDWKQVEIPFFLGLDQRADLLHLNLVFEGRGTVRLKDIEVLSAPVAKR